MTPAFRLSTRTLLLVATVVTGCGAFTVPDARPTSNPLAPVWNAAHIRQHLGFLHGRSVRGRIDGTIGYGVAASYVAERLDDYGLQPATSGDFRLLYTTPRNLVRASRVRLGDKDTLSLRPGIDFQPDGRSGNAFVAISGLGVSTSNDDWIGPALPILRRGHQSTEQLIRLRDLGVPMVLVERETLVPRPAARAVAGLGILNVTGGAADRIIAGATSTTVMGQGVLTLRFPVRIEIIADADLTASGINVVGFVPGKDPILAREAVILCTHLDAVGSFGGAQFVDLRNYGVEVAAVLDVARQYAAFSRLMRIPERTLIVALVAGGTIDSGGLRALVRQSVWDVGLIRSIVYVGTPMDGTPQLADAAGPLADRLRVVLATDTIPRIVRPVLVRPRSASRPGETRTTGPQAYTAEGVRSASDLAARLYALTGTLLMSESATTASRAGR